jgi:hypothetical protein
MMTLNNLKENTIKNFLKEGILNDSIKKRILSIKSLKDLKSLSTSMHNRKKNLLETEKNLQAHEIQVWFDTKIMLQNLDGKGYGRVITKANEIFSFLIKKQKTIEVAKNNKFPNRIILELEKSKDKIDMERVLDQLPPILLVKLKLKKLKSSGAISTTKSIRSISTPMRD